MTEHIPNPIEQPGRLEIYNLALAESRTAFEDLMTQPEKIRRSVGALLGFAAVVVTIFGTLAAPLTHWAAALCQASAVLGVVGLAICTAVLMVPKKFVPSMRADLIVRWGDAGDTEARAVKSLALGTEKNYQHNVSIVETMSRWQIGATVCFGVTVCALAARTLGA